MKDKKGQIPGAGPETTINIWHIMLILMGVILIFLAIRYAVRFLQNS
jgi:hypothetical protein